MIVFPTHTTLLNALVASVFCLKEQKAKKATTAEAKIPLRVIPDFAFTTITESAFISKSSI